MDMCLPSKEIILRQLKRVIKAINNSPQNENNHKTIRSIFVASDNNHMIEELQAALKRMKILVTKLDYSSPHVDLAILGQANHFIGNCISSFTAFVKRERDVKGFSSSFWAFPGEKSAIKKVQTHEEL
ncbi:hypothetical protein GWI33_000550 [Rhynchophorus ferrugineus]|uniref:GDP-fucose protein O-fucosyltransferase 1 n=1 Tax=Rhynchophorus ferrugineus TaxID=354439 RepID=A0A834IZM1_RHYFE|nr:hypothetical protein GWI33_000550 [Rhynchophorus ferrugineus]